MLLIGAAVLTVVLSWALINTVYTLRYADQHFQSRPGGIAFGTEDGQQHPGYRDFAYVAFTIGMTYQVSDTTLRDPQIRRTVLAHAVCRTCSAWSSWTLWHHLGLIFVRWSSQPARIHLG